MRLSAALWALTLVACSAVVDSAGRSKARRFLQVESDLSSLDALRYRAFDPSGTVAANTEIAFNKFVKTSGLAGKLTAEKSALYRHLIEKDLGSLDTLHYREFEPHGTVVANAKRAFDQFVKTSGLANELTAEESARYRQRFSEEIEAKRGVASTGKQFSNVSSWLGRIAKALQDQKPAVTFAMVASVNHKGVGWEARNTSQLQNLSAHDVKRLCGVRLDATEVQALEEQSMANANSTLLSKGADSTPVDARLLWPLCADVIGHVRDQGPCGSSWATSAAAIIESRLCITTGGAFTGPAAYISADYLTSCALPPDQNGCDGGSTLGAFDWSRLHGVPTGGSGNIQATCVSSSFNDSALSHFAGHAQSPPCPTKCTSDIYTQSLKEDSSLSVGMSGVRTGSFSLLKDAIRSSGPAAIVFAVYSDFMAYSSGVYRHVSQEKMGIHATVAIGYGYTGAGHAYVLGINSWGEGWGDRGLFMIQASEVLQFVVPEANDFTR